MNVMGVKRNWLLLVAILWMPALAVPAQEKKGMTDRELWCGVMYRMAAPVLSNMSEGKLQENMPAEVSPTWDGRDKRVTYMECFGRLMAGLAPWLSLPEELPGGQVRAAMTAVIKRMFGDDRNFNEKGFLVLGFNGSQSNISDWYTDNGSLYLASLAFLPLGLPAGHPFWTDAPLPWTSKKAWEGEDFPKDHAYHE